MQKKKSVGKMKNDPLGIFYRRIKASRGALIAVKATARKIAVLFYSIMNSTIDKYINPGVEEYSRKLAEGQIKYLRKKAILELFPTPKIFSPLS